MRVILPFFPIQNYKSLTLLLFLIFSFLLLFTKSPLNTLHTPENRFLYKFFFFFVRIRIPHTPWRSFFLEASCFGAAISRTMFVHDSIIYFPYQGIFLTEIEGAEQKFDSG
ncbi:uncharacterized protein DS421_18g624540 [Arachis hypogaea]|nr:uncharacterized protein DS421_18g624540 [Arachis hypogaea]